MSKLLYTCLLSLVAFIASAENDPLDHSWKTIEAEQTNGIIARFKVRNNPNLTIRDWLSLEIDNQTQQTLFINHAVYSIDCEVYDKKGGKLIKSGRIASRSAADLFDKALDSPLPTSDLSPGMNTSAKFPSTIGALLLSVPDRSKVYVRAMLNLEMQIGGKEGNFTLKWNTIPFDFDWYRPEPTNFSELYHYVDTLLGNPVFSTLQHYELSMLLAQPEIAQGFEAKTLVLALRNRVSKEDGRLAVLYHLNDHFPNHPLLLDYYYLLLRAADPLALEELAIATNIWDDRFLEPLLALYEAGNTGQMVRVMNVLYNQQNKWIDKENIPTIISDLTLYKFDEIIYESPSNLSSRDLLTISVVLDLLGKSGDPKMATVICPFLDEEERILDTGLMLDPNSLELPRPMRVCDNALEAIMRLNKIDMIKTYKKAKFQPPYENGEGEVIISRVRDQLIKSTKKKYCK